MIPKNKFFIFIFLITNVLLGQNSEVKLLFTGDIMGHGPQIQAAYDDKTKSYNYENCFIYMKDILSEPDFSIGNLEVTLGTKPYTGYPMFSSPPELATATKKAGIDVLATANNHSCDRKEKGIVRTINLLDSLNINHFGTYKNGQDKNQKGLMLLEKNNIKIGLLNYTYGTNGIAINDSSMVSFLDKKTIQNDIAQAKKHHADVLIAYVHWGLEYKDLPVQEQKDWFAFFKENGVNIVIGSHPHVVEPMEWNKEDKTLVVYSLGNFISNQRFFRSDGGAVFELTLKKNAQQVEISNAEYILTWVYKREHQGQTDYLVLPVSEFEYKRYFFNSSADYQQMIKYAHHARTLLKKNNKNINEKNVFVQDAQLLMRELRMQPR